MRMIVTDLDGTLLGSGSDREFQPNFVQRIEEFQKNGGLWVIATGRGFRSTHKLLHPLWALGARPDFIIARHAYIYGKTRVGYIPHPFWNYHIRKVLSADVKALEEAVMRIRVRTLRGYKSARLIIGEEDRLHLRFTDAQDCRKAVPEIRQMAAENHSLMVFEFKQDVVLRSVPFTKGLAVQEVCRHRNMMASDVLAIGDGENDVSLLDGKVSGYCGCPANSVAAVMEVVHRRNGHISRTKTLGGVVDILKAFESGEIDPRLPQEMLPPFARDQREPLKKRRRDPTPRVRPVHYLLTAGGGYVILAALAAHNLLPFSRYIVKPIEILMGGIGRLSSALGL